jgi:hypothetical protein
VIVSIQVFRIHETLKVLKLIFSIQLLVLNLEYIPLNFLFYLFAHHLRQMIRAQLFDCGLILTKMVFSLDLHKFKNCEKLKNL